ncbi:MAG: VWA domain-containing protein [Chitinophagales bacterium]|nr:VWA domain-containing protein [Chitinophagales bacterium]
MNLTFQYPYWFVLLCLALGAAYAIGLYYRNSFISDPSPRQRSLFKVLGVLRFVVVSLVAMLLLSPFIKMQSTESQKPVIVLLQDNSESIGNTLSDQDSIAYAKAFAQMTEELGKQYDIKQYSFDSKLNDSFRMDYMGKLTNLSDNLSNIYSLYSNQNVGAVVLASDGIYNEGSNPLYTTSSNMRFPVFTVAMGDTTPQRDLKIGKAYFNKIVYLKDKFKVGADLLTQNISAANTRFAVYDYTNSNQPIKLNESPVSFTADGQIITQEFVLDAKQAGVKHYRLVLSPVQGEFTEVNNYKDIFIEVLDSRQKVLILANSPHPDIAAIKAAAENNQNYEVSLRYAAEVGSFDPAQYNLVILHQLPSQRNPIKPILDKLKNSSTAAWFIVGSQTHINLFNASQNALNIGQGGASLNEVTADFKTDFSIFTVSDKLKAQLARFPPLAAPFGQYRPNGSSRVMLNQQIGSVATDYPLLVFNESMGSKTAVLCGEGLWKWKINDYRFSKNNDAFNELVGKTIQSLAVKQDKRQFRVRLEKNLFLENESVDFQAELYNDNYELINTPDVTLTITDGAGKDYSMQFSRTGNAYALNAGSFKPGTYTYRAKVIYNGKELSFDGQFTITPMEMEAANTVADHQLLYQLSEQSGGKMYYPKELGQLTKAILGNAQIKPVLYETFKTQPFINLKGLFALIVLLLSVEWFARKYFGGY